MQHHIELSAQWTYCHAGVCSAATAHALDHATCNWGTHPCLLCVIAINLKKCHIWVGFSKALVLPCEHLCIQGSSCLSGCDGMDCSFTCHTGAQAPPSPCKGDMSAPCTLGLSSQTRGWSAAPQTPLVNIPMQHGRADSVSAPSPYHRMAPVNASYAADDCEHDTETC
jgi:hypothetical protein